MSLQKRFKKPVPSIVAISGPRLLSVHAAAEYLSANVWTIRQLIRNRQLPRVPLGQSRKHLIDRFDLDRFIDKNKAEVAA